MRLKPPRWPVALGALTAIAMAVVLTVQLPGAATREDVGTRVDAQHERLAELENESTAIHARLEDRKVTLREVRKQKADLGRRLQEQQRLIASLKDRIEELGG